MTDQRPPPEDLLQQAQAEPPKPSLLPYEETVLLLREKGLSYRKIATWFVARGVDVNYGDVCYVCKRAKADRV